MRKKIVAGNWKMNTLPAEGVELAKGVAAGKGEVCDSVNFIVCPPFTHLHSVIETLKGTAIEVGAQDCATEVKGAYTGEVAASMIAALGCKYVILGHSERRQYYGETSESLNKKMARAYENNLVPIYCVGENLEEREAGRHFEVCKQQIEEVVFNLSEEQFAKLVIAYEPTSLLPNTYISWKNNKAILTLPKGRHTLGMSCTETSQAKINWLRITL